MVLATLHRLPRCWLLRSTQPHLCSKISRLVMILYPRIPIVSAIYGHDTFLMNQLVRPVELLRQSKPFTASGISQHLPLPPSTPSVATHLEHEYSCPHWTAHSVRSLASGFCPHFWRHWIRSTYRVCWRARKTADAVNLGARGTSRLGLSKLTISAASTTLLLASVNPCPGMRYFRSVPTICRVCV